jgi:hypothetical protein
LPKLILLHTESLFKTFLFCIWKEIEGGIALLLMSLNIDRNQNCEIQVAAMADNRGLCSLKKSKIAETDPATHRITFYVIFV